MLVRHPTQVFHWGLPRVDACGDVGQSLRASHTDSSSKTGKKRKRLSKLSPKNRATNPTCQRCEILKHLHGPCTGGPPWPPPIEYCKDFHSGAGHGGPPVQVF